MPTGRRIAVFTLTALATTSAAGAQQAGNLVYTAVAPCRIVDTRLTTEQAFDPDEVRAFNVVGIDGFGPQGGAVGGCGLPGYSGGTPRVAAVMFNFALVTPSGPGHLRAWASGAPPNASILNFSATAGMNVANGIAVPVDQDATPGADLQVMVRFASAHLVIDVVGYFSPITLTDGPGSGIDADTLDGHELADFALGAHTHAGEDVASGTVAAARIDAAIARLTDVVPTMLAADGSGSTLDADLLDGLDSNAFQRRYAKVAVVALAGGDYTEPVAAMAALATWCGTPGGNNRCLIQIMPGRYALPGTLVIPSFVDVAGMGPSSTVLDRTGSASPGVPAVQLNGSAELRELAVVHSGSSHTLAVRVTAGGGKIRQAWLEAQASGSTATAVQVASTGGVTVEDSTLLARFTAPTVTGVQVLGGGSAVVRRSSLTVSAGGAGGTAVWVDADGTGGTANARIEASSGSVSGGSAAALFGIRAQSAAAIKVRDLELTVSGAGPVGVLADNSDFTADGLTLSVSASGTEAKGLRWTAAAPMRFPVLRRSVVTLTTGGATSLIGFDVSGVLQPFFEDVALTVNGQTGDSVGLLRGGGGGTAGTLRRTNIALWGGASRIGVKVLPGGGAVLDGCRVFPSGVGVETEGATAVLDSSIDADIAALRVVSGSSVIGVSRSTLDGATNSIVNNSGMPVRVGASQLAGPVSNTGAGSIGCVVSYNQSFTLLSASCT